MAQPGRRRTPSGPFDPARSLTAATSAANGREPHPTEHAWRRRISYFMLVRLAMLAAFTGVAAVLATTGSTSYDALHAGFVWGTLMVGYALTIVFARMLPRARDLRRLAWLQTTTDIVLAAVVVQMSGGVESGFAWLYLIAVLGAATMGGAAQTWAAAGACALIWIALTSLQVADLVDATTLGEPIPPPPLPEVLAASARTLSALVGVAILSSYLGRQLTTTVSQVGDLQALNENIVRSLSSGLVTIDSDGRVLYFNPAAQHILGLDDSVLGRDVEHLLPGLGAAIEAHDGDASRIELSLPGPDGRARHLGLTRSELVDGSQRQIGHVVNFQDLTRLHELTEQVRRGERLAALGSLAASLAHEVRNPLTAIDGSAQLLTRSAALPQEDVALLQIITREAARLSKLVTELLAFTRPRAPQIATLSLPLAVRETSDALLSDPKNAAIRIEIVGPPQLQVRFDPAQLSQVLWNLLRNAAEAMDGAGAIEVRIAVDGPLATLTVRDEGPGVDPEHVARLFDPFFTTKEHGTGFGLAIVHRIVADNGGAIRVEAPPGGGAAFVVSLPRAG